MNLTIRQLRAFIAVAGYSSFTEASRSLHLTQSALSVLIREMERELGVKLFDRNTRNVALTEIGEEFHPSAVRMLRDLDAAVTSVSDLREKRRGLLRLAAPQLMACTLIPQLIAHWRVEFPLVGVRLTDTLPEDLLGALQSAQAELAIGPDMMALADQKGDIESSPLFRDRHWLVCPGGHELGKRQKVRWEELAAWPFIPPTRDFARRVLPEVGPLPAHMLAHPAHSVSYMTTAMGLVAAGLGLTVVPTYAGALVKAHGLRMIRLEQPALYREVCVYRVAGRALSPAAESFLSRTRDFIKRER